MLNCNALKVHLEEDDLRYLLHMFELNIFKHLYDVEGIRFHKKYYEPIFKSRSLRFLSFLKRKVSLPCEETTEKVFNELGLTRVLENVVYDKRYNNIYRSYSVLLELHSGEVFPVYVNDLKLLLKIARIQAKDLKEFSKIFAEKNKRNNP